MGVDVDPARIDAETGIQASYSHRAGDPKIFRNAEGAWSNGIWSLRSPLPQEASLDAHLAWIASNVDRLRDVIAAAVSRGARADVFVGVFDVAESYGLVVAPENMAELGRAGLSLGLDIYAASPDSDSEEEPV